MQLAGKAQSTAFLQRDHVQGLEVAAQLQLPDGVEAIACCIVRFSGRNWKAGLRENDGAVPAVRGLPVELAMLLGPQPHHTTPHHPGFVVDADRCLSMERVVRNL